MIVLKERHWRMSCIPLFHMLVPETGTPEIASFFPWGEYVMGSSLWLPGTPPQVLWNWRGVHEGRIRGETTPMACDNDMTKECRVAFKLVYELTSYSPGRKLRNYMIISTNASVKLKRFEQHRSLRINIGKASMNSEQQQKCKAEGRRRLYYGSMYGLLALAQVSTLLALR